MTRLLLVLVLGGLAFAAGIAVDRFALPHSPGQRAGSIAVSDSLDSFEAEAPADLSGNAAGTRKPGQKSVSKATSVDAVVAALRNAMNRPNDRRGYLQATNLIDAIEPGKIRAVIDGFQSLPNQREKPIYLAMLIARWAEAEPQAAATYAESGPASDRRMAVAAAVRSWAEKDAAAANAWVQQLPAGQEREFALQAVVSSLAESDPQSALTMLQGFPAGGHGRQGFYWPIFSRWTSTDPQAAASKQRPCQPVPDVILRSR